MARTLLFLYAESPVHAGADTSVGALDLPMQRDRHTGLPVIWGQSLKGAMRSHARPLWKPREDFLAAFGAEPPGSTETESTQDPSETLASRQPGGDLPPGTLSIGDAELVAFPAPALIATFAWLTSSLSLARLRRKAALVGVVHPDHAPEGRDQGVAHVGADRWIGQQVAVGPYLVTGRRVDVVGAWAAWLSERAIPGHGKLADDHHRYFREKFKDDLVVVGDGVLERVSVECAEVTPRIQLKVGQKTVHLGPFHTEYLPTESLLATVIEGSQAHIDKLRDLLHGQILRVGGDETIGKGLMWCSFLNPVETS